MIIKNESLTECVKVIQNQLAVEVLNLARRVACNLEVFLIGIVHTVQLIFRIEAQEDIILQNLIETRSTVIGAKGRIQFRVAKIVAEAPIFQEVLVLRRESRFPEEAENDGVLEVGAANGALWQDIFKICANIVLNIELHICVDIAQERRIGLVVGVNGTVIASELRKIGRVIDVTAEEVG